MLKAVDCVHLKWKSFCDWCSWCYCASWLKSVKNAPRKFNARPNLISFSRFMALVMRSAGLSWTDTLWSRRRPVCSHSCTLSIFNSIWFIRPGPRRLHTASALCESVSGSGTVLYCHSFKSCAAPKPSIAPEPMPYNTASALERALVFCATSQAFALLSSVGFLIDLENVFTLCWMSGRWWLKYIVLPTHVLKFRASLGVSDSSSPSCPFFLMVSGMRLVLAFSIPNAVAIPWMRRGFPCNEYPLSNFRRFVAKKSTFVAQAHCILHVQLVSMLVPESVRWNVMSKNEKEDGERVSECVWSGERRRPMMMKTTCKKKKDTEWDDMIWDQPDQPRKSTRGPITTDSHTHILSHSDREMPSPALACFQSIPVHSASTDSSRAKHWCSEWAGRHESTLLSHVTSNSQDPPRLPNSHSFSCPVFSSLARIYERWSWRKRGEKRKTRSEDEQWKSDENGKNGEN